MERHALEAVLVSRADGHDATYDQTLDVVLAGQGKTPRQALEAISYKTHAVNGYSPFGSGETGEFATFRQGREVWDEHVELREAVEDDLRLFAERADHSEGFILTSPPSTAFSGLASTFLTRTIRDEFPKLPVWSTGMLTDATGWKRADTARSKAQRVLNEALALVEMGEYASMFLPVQPVRGWDEKRKEPWRKYLRDDVDRCESYRTVLTMHLQSAGSELREPDALSEIPTLLNYRTTTRIASISGMAPLLTEPWLRRRTELGEAEELWRERVRGMEKAWGRWEEKEGERDEEMDDLYRPSRLRSNGTSSSSRSDQIPYARYSILRGLDFEESQALGPVLEEYVKPLREPLVRWVSLPDAYPLLPGSTPPIFCGLHPQTGLPLVLPPAPLPKLPSSSSSTSVLFGNDPTAPKWPSAMEFTQQPSSIPLMTTLSTDPAQTTPYIKHLVSTLTELRRVRAPVLKEYEADGEDGSIWSECREALERVLDEYGGGELDEGDKDEDEDWGATEQQDEFDL
ncbi:tubulin/FtsZ, GTPase domain containing protein [Rhodotorula toruloides]|uniref:Tubulin/FtsZ, GTPase domain containing protein n=1 Tax=Rhodotorula toruloides TaxID=5286 RepID=A0A511KQJ9_RHOTO|nr:tubulin/FtsZ, GTPase domain containing protein [Rhodotorula toruloides]